MTSQISKKRLKRLASSNPSREAIEVLTAVIALITAIIGLILVSEGNKRPPISPTPMPKPTQVIEVAGGTYPCAGIVVSLTASSGQICQQIRENPAGEPYRNLCITPGETVTIQAQQDYRNAHYYLFAQNNTQIGWIRSDYISPLDTCTQ
jgi:hypothetical protein